MIREKVKNLWKLCFDDTDEYVDLYFQYRYNNDVNIAIQSGEEVIAALQMLPYPMTLNEKEIQASYISGACTHPDYRNRGVMHELLSQAFSKMLQKDIAISTLIPAEPWLFGYYARQGYAPVFKYRKCIFTASQTVLKEEEDGLVLAETCEYQESIYEYLNRKLRERPNCIQHTKEDFQFILSDLQLNEGQLYTLKQNDHIIALAIAYPVGNKGWYLEEIISDTPETHSILLQRICEKNKVPSVEVCMPPIDGADNLTLGMARIINAKTMLQLYAAAHPELEVNLRVTDEIISANNRYFYLSNGKCMSSAKRLPGNHSTLTISELTEKVFASLRPYMSLMLNN